MSKIIEASDLPEGDKVYLKKDRFGWRTVEPVKKDPSKPLNLSNINWINLLVGGWRNFIFLIIVVLLLLFSIYAYNHDMKIAKDYMANPCDYCTWCKDIQTGKVKTSNWPNFSLDLNGVVGDNSS